MTRLGAVVGAFALMSGAGLSFSSGRAPAAVAPVGEGFVVTPADLTFILNQIKIAERHAQAFEGNPAAAVQPNPNPITDPSYCLAMIGTGADRVPDAITS